MGSGKLSIDINKLMDELGISEDSKDDWKSFTSEDEKDMPKNT